MANKYRLPELELQRIRLRDRKCVYCHRKLNNPKTSQDRRTWATIEHLNHLPPWNNPLTVAICCGSCNSSRSAKQLQDWFKSSYCIEKNINELTVAQSVKLFLKMINQV